MKTTYQKKNLTSRAEKRKNEKFTNETSRTENKTHPRSHLREKKLRIRDTIDNYDYQQLKKPQVV